MGKLCYLLNKIDDAFKYLEKSLSEKEDYSETYYYLGECFKAKG